MSDKIESENKEEAKEISEKKEIEVKEEEIEIKEEIKEEIEVENIEKEEIKKEEIKENIQVKEVNTKKEKKEKRKLITTIIITIILLLSIVAFSVIFALLNINNNKIISGVTISGINVSNLTKEEANKYLNEKVSDKIAKTIKLKYNNEYETTINLEQIEANYNINEAIEEAFEIGRNSNIVINNYNILLAMVGKKDVELGTNINEELFDKVISDISAKIPGAVVQNSYYIEGEELVIKRGTKGIDVTEEFIQE